MLLRRAKMDNINLTHFYKIGTLKSKYSESAMLSMAIERGFSVNKDVKITSADQLTVMAIAFLRKNGYNIIECFSTAGADDLKSEVHELLPIPVEKEENEKSLEEEAYEQPLDPKVMIAYVQDGVYLINTEFLGEECWDIQAFGTLGCTGCPDKGKESCYGGVSEAGLDSKNSKGNMIPIAERIGVRPKRKK
jgi:hypothetical protein